MNEQWLSGEIPWGEQGRCLRFPSRIVSVTVDGTDNLRVETEVTAHVIGPRDWRDGFATQLTWRAQLRIRLHEWLSRLGAQVLQL